MTKQFSRVVIGICVIGASLSVNAQRQRGGQGQGVRQLVQDVQSAATHATLSDDQKSKLQGDIDGINAAFQARQQGQTVDRDKVTAAIGDMRQIVDSGAFQEDDQGKLDKEFDAIGSR